MTELKWHPYPEEKPKFGSYLVQVKDKGIELMIYNQNGFSNYNNILAWMPMPSPYIPPVKKKTMLVSVRKMLERLDKECGVTVAQSLVFRQWPEFIEIEADE